MSHESANTASGAMLHTIPAMLVDVQRPGLTCGTLPAPLRAEHLAPLLQFEQHLPGESQLESLQEALLELIQQALLEAGVDTRQRVVVGLDAQGNLDVQAQGQSQELLCALEARPQIRHHMSQLAALELAAQGVRHLTQARRLLEKKQQNASSPIIFQACLQGSLSHFHLVSGAVEQ